MESQKRWCVTGRVCEQYLVWHKKYEVGSRELVNDEVVRLISLPQEIDSFTQLAFPSVVISNAFFLWFTPQPYHDGVVAVVYENGVARVLSFVDNAESLDGIEQVIGWKSPKKIAETNYSAWYTQNTALPTGVVLLVAFATRINNLSDEIVRLNRPGGDVVPVEEPPVTTRRPPPKYKGAVEY